MPTGNKMTGKWIPIILTIVFTLTMGIGGWSVNYVVDDLKQELVELRGDLDKLDEKLDTHTSAMSELTKAMNAGNLDTKLIEQSVEHLEEDFKEHCQEAHK